MNLLVRKLGSLSVFCSLLSISGLAQSPPNESCGTTLRFDGSGDKVTFVNTPLTASGTFETWISKDDWSDHVDDVIFANNIGHTDANSFYMSLHDVVGLHMRYGGGGEPGNMYVNSNDTKSLVDGSWHHIAGTWENVGGQTTIAIYLDGVLLDSETQTITIDMGSTFQLGINPNSATLKNAQIDELRIWNYARSGTEIQADMNSLLEGDEPGLVGYYGFDEVGPSPVVYDYTSNENNGTLVDIDPSSAFLQPDGSAPCPLTPPNDECGTVLNFDGTNQTIGIPHNTLLKPSSQITIEAWAYPTDISTNKYYEIYRKEDGSDRHLLSFQEFGTILSFGLRVGGTYSELDVTIDPADYVNTWVHIAATFDGTTKRLYANGIEIGTESVSGSIGTGGTANAFIGSASGSTEYFEGRMDEVRIWSTAKSANEIIAGLAAELEGTEADLIAYYNFNDGMNSSVLLDHSGNNLDGILVNIDAATAWTLPDSSAGGAITNPTPIDIELEFGDSVEVAGEFIYTPGAYIETLTSESGCDSNITYLISMTGEPDNEGCETALNFDGDNDYVQLSNPLAIGSTSNTVELWVKIPLPDTEGLTATERIGNILGNYNNTPNTNWELHTSGRTRIFWNNGELNEFGTYDLRDNTWHHLAFVRNTSDDSFKIYVDGEIDLDHPSAGSDITFATSPKIGADNRAGGGPKFHGSMDEIRIWDYAMTEEEIVWAASAQMEGSEPGLVNYFNFNEGTGSTELFALTTAENNGTLMSMDPATDWTTNDGSVLPEIDLVSVDATTLDCHDDDDAEIEITATGGTGVLQYSIDNGDNFGTTNLFENLMAGIYEVVVQDDNECWKKESIEILNPVLFEIDGVFETDPTCDGDTNGIIDVVINGGTGNVMVSFDNGNNFQNDAALFNASAGSYDIVIEDANGCRDSATAELTAPDPVDIGVTQAGNELTAESTGGTFQWLDCDDESAIASETSSVFTATNSGMYSVEVTEGACIDTSACFTVIITDIRPDFVEHGLKVYPNPTAGATTIDLGQSFDFGLVTISDITGQLIEQVALNGEELIEVTIEKPAGVYFVNIKSGEMQRTIKVIKE